MDSAFMNDELNPVNADKCDDIRAYCGYQIAASKQYRLTQELFDKLKERGITIKMKENKAERELKRKLTTQSS